MTVEKHRISDRLYCDLLRTVRSAASLAMLVCCMLVSGRAISQSYYALEFRENKGQWTGDFDFRAKAGNAEVFIRRGTVTMRIDKEEDMQSLASRMHGHEVTENAVDLVRLNKADPGERVRYAEIKLRSHAYRMDFLGASVTGGVEASGILESNANYFLGKDPSKWRTGMKSYAKIMYRDLYPGMDCHYRSEGGQLKYDLVVHPGADISRVRMRYTGTEGLRLEDGALVIRTSVGETKELKPLAYQVIDGLKELVPCRYVLRGNIVEYEVGRHDARHDLVIDPTFIFGTFTGSRASEWGFNSAPGPDGSLFSAGIVFGTGYPVTTGAFQTTFAGGTTLNVDVGITRFSPDGRRRMYSVYLGGSGDDIPICMSSDAQGSLVIMGRTNSQNFPITRANYGSCGLWDIFISKISPDGLLLQASMKIGGSGNDGANMDPGYPNACTSMMYGYGDNNKGELILDKSGNVYLSSQSQSNDFPLTKAIQPQLAGRQDAVVMKLSSDLSQVNFSSYFGGSQNDAGFALALNPVNGRVFMTGPTESADLPGDRTGVLQPDRTGGAGDVDGYVTEIDPSSGALIRTSYLGTGSIDIVYGIQVDAGGHPYVTGISLGAWTVTANVKYADSGAHQFISKLKSDLSGFVYSTIYGTSSSLPNITPIAFKVDACENVHVTGWGGRLSVCTPIQDCFSKGSSGTQGMRTTDDAIQKTTDGRDLYILVMGKDAGSLVYGSFIGQNGGEGDHVDGGWSHYDEDGSIYQSFCSNCGGNLVVTCSPVIGGWGGSAGVVAPVNGALNAGGAAGDCNSYAFRIMFAPTRVKIDLNTSINFGLHDSVGCVPFNVHFQDTTGNGVSRIWDFGDGSPLVQNTAFSVDHVYATPGDYKAKLISINNSLCTPIDSVIVTIHARAGGVATLGFDWTDKDACSTLSYAFTPQLSDQAGAPITNASVTWIFSDGSMMASTSAVPVQHVFTTPGTYDVSFKLTDPRFCNQGAALSKQVKVASIRPETPTVTQVSGNLQSSAPTGVQWYLDDQAITGATTQQFRPSISGYYSVTTMNLGCVSERSQKFYYLVTGLVNLDSGQFIKVYPNPVGTKEMPILEYRLNGSLAGVMVSIHDIQGTFLGSRKVTSSGTSIPIPEAPGEYLLDLRWANGRKHSFKIIKF